MHLTVRLVRVWTGLAQPTFAPEVGQTFAQVVRSSLALRALTVGLGRGGERQQDERLIVDPGGLVVRASILMDRRPIQAVRPAIMVQIVQGVFARRAPGTGPACAPG